MILGTVVVLVVTLTGVSFFLTTPQGRDTSSSSTISSETSPLVTTSQRAPQAEPVTCNRSVSSGVGSLSDLATVYHIIATHSVICLSYNYGHVGQASFLRYIQSWSQTGEEVSGSQQCTTASESLVCPGFTITPSPESATFEQVNESVSVSYAIRASDNASGLYVFFLTNGSPIYLSFGRLPSSVYLTAWTSGPALPPGDLIPSYVITGLTNVDVVSVPWT